MSSFGKRSGIEGYSTELTKALAPQSGGEPRDRLAVEAHADLTAVQVILSAATAGESRAKMAAAMSGVRTKRPGL
jgi:hypothetical protein